MKPMVIRTLKCSIPAVLLFLFILCISSSTYIYKLRSSLTTRGVTNRTLTFEYLTQVQKSCERTTDRTSVLIGIISSADNFESRAAIRDTWGGTARKMGFVVVFMLGATLDQEVQRNGFGGT
ncbi:hypothetical protein MTO96_015735 [Rhipicephalus appendiculatus]